MTDPIGTLLGLLRKTGLDLDSDLTREGIAILTQLAQPSPVRLAPIR